MKLTILCQFTSWKTASRHIWYEGLNCKIFLWLRCLPPAPPAICSMQRITLASQYPALLGFFPVCNIIFQIIDQWRYFFQLCDKNLILKRSLTLNNTNTYVSNMSTQIPIQKESMGPSILEVWNKNIFNFFN